MYEDDFLESAYEERYEQPDYEVWETNRVYEDMALEREQQEADAEAAALEAEVRGVVEDVAENLPWLPLDLVQTIAERILTYQRDQRAN